ncbi:thiamine monophosphate synthase [Flexistipes sinusarabici DSM 4947]|uniref:Thiamine monophosphate synthase n=1 Tax=Flexistipes sinusarabici (strain ATCC 49648 / DSM 4947 / MAS 10) TaxID=717231 RepID=F8E6X5_FLESM|nr:thiamine phosphate synthase [Flexistipes sinusarabici]AEI13761.1 thiamine monophosphate synthase [Flexistipes sinusarabici DSM 4947]
MKKIIFVLDFDTFKDTLFETALYAAKFDVCIWLRIKGRSGRFVFNTAYKIRKLVPQAHLILSERADIAHLCSFESVHLNAGSPPPQEIRMFFPDLTVGYSAHSKDEIRETEADYYTLSPLFYTKKNYPVAPLENTDLTGINKKIYALGGINSSNISKVKDMGFYGAAGISFVQELPRIKKFFNQP